MEALISSLKQVRAVALGAEHRMRRLKKRLIVAEETFRDILSVTGAIPIYAERTTMIGYHTHLIAYGADSAFLLVKAAVRIEAVRKFDGKGECLTKTAYGEDASTRTGWICAVCTHIRDLLQFGMAGKTGMISLNAH